MVNADPATPLGAAPHDEGKVNQQGAHAASQGDHQSIGLRAKGDVRAPDHQPIGAHSRREYFYLLYVVEPIRPLSSVGIQEGSSGGL